MSEEQIMAKHKEDLAEWLRERDLVLQSTNYLEMTYTRRSRGVCTYGTMLDTGIVAVFPKPLP